MRGACAHSQWKLAVRLLLRSNGAPRQPRCGVQGGALLGVCNQGTWCDTGDLSHGTCKRVSAEGETCDDYKGLRCAWSLFCRDGRCQKPQAEGGACKAPGTGRFGILECRDELFCDGDNGQAGTCRPRRDAGAACRNAFECEDDMSCTGARPTEGVWGTCQPGPARASPARGSSVGRASRARPPPRSAWPPCAWVSRARTPTPATSPASAWTAPASPSEPGPATEQPCAGGAPVSACADGRCLPFEALVCQ